MPTISAFYGILIQMFWGDHALPHFHALYAEHEVLIDITTLEVIRGSTSPSIGFSIGMGISTSLCMMKSNKMVVGFYN